LLAVTRRQPLAPPDLRDLPDRKVRPTTIGIETGTGKRIRADGIKLHHAQQDSITIQMGVASGTRTELRLHDGGNVKLPALVEHSLTPDKSDYRQVSTGGPKLSG
jgi:hypothetical protein